ncbi:MAG: ADP-ribosylglycohydrolase family protein [Flavobacteriaceae bacterium]|nr:ADP-ribosylglycohydrolase family protein [Flavobacteriaceae bacterium]
MVIEITELDSYHDLKDRAKKALSALFVADSIAMPVHWYYRVSDIYKEFENGVQKLEDAPSYHPSSIMSAHSTQQGGRKYLNSKNSKNIVGDVILKGRGKYWNQANIHYHHGMKAGENTLNAHCVRWLFQSMIDTKGRYYRDSYLQLYISMMTADKPIHKDTYAESYHRGFFANYIKGKDINNCAAITHDTASIGGLVSIGPLAIILFLSGYDLIYVQSQCANHLSSTHPDDFLSQIANQYIDLLQQLLLKDEDQSAKEIILNQLNKTIKLNVSSKDLSKISDRDFVGGKFSSACYITDSWPSVLFLAAKYVDDIKGGVLSNANLGGDNVHRGAVLAIILSLANDSEHSNLESFYKQLNDYQAIDSEINYLLSLI